MTVRTGGVLTVDPDEWRLTLFALVPNHDAMASVLGFTSVIVKERDWLFWIENVRFSLADLDCFHAWTPFR